MRYIILILFTLFSVLIFGQNGSLLDEFNKIEQSNNYEKNIVDLEELLKTNNLDKDFSLKIQVQLINNYINVFQYEKADEFC